MSSVFDAINTQNDVSDEKRAEVLSEFPTPKGGTKQVDGDARQHTDADSIRRHFGITEWDRSRFDWPSVFPNCMDHQWDAPVEELSGGTDVFARGKPGSGKSTLLNYLSARLMDINEETVVWRGSTSRSEWLPLAPWTTLCLPEGVEVDARLESRKKSEPSVPLDVDDLEKIVRDVQRYSDPIDLNHRVLEPGGFHVVFPDPELRGCAEIYRADDERTYDTPAKRDNLFSEEDPATHWWFGWFLGRVNHGPHHWTTLVLDEIGDVVPQDAQKDQFGTYQKVDLMKDAWVDARKHGLSVFGAGHSAKDVHQKIRHKLRWRIQMPNQANPVRQGQVVGFESVPMDNDIASAMDIGKSLMYTETRFEKFQYPHLPLDVDHKLIINLGGRSL